MVHGLDHSCTACWWPGAKGCSAAGLQAGKWLKLVKETRDLALSNGKDKYSKELQIGLKTNFERVTGYASQLPGGPKKALARQLFDACEFIAISAYAPMPAKPDASHFTVGCGTHAASLVQCGQFRHCRHPVASWHCSITWTLVPSYQIVWCSSNNNSHRLDCVLTIRCFLMVCHLLLQDSAVIADAELRQLGITLQGKDLWWAPGSSYSDHLKPL